MKATTDRSDETESLGNDVAECVSISGSTLGRVTAPQPRNAHPFRYTAEAEPIDETLTRSATQLDVAGVADPGSATSPPSRLWLWFVAAFLIQCAAWTTWFVIASHHRVEEVPLNQEAVE
jgi:hypothetical protein